MGKLFSKEGDSVATDGETLEIPTEQTPTVFPAADFNAVTDADNLNKALQSLGANGSIVNKILANRSWDQRQEIKDAYHSKYSKALISDINNQATGQYRNVLEGLLIDNDTLRANYVSKILEDRLLTRLPDTRGKDVAIMETIYPLTKTEIQGLKSAYEKIHGNPLHKDIEEKIPGNLKDWIVSLIQTGRNEGRPSAMAIAKDISYLKNLPVDQWDASTEALTKLFVKQSNFYLFAVFNTYELETGTKLMEFAEQTNTDIREAFKVIIGSCLDGYEFFSDALYQSMKGFGTNDEKLIYIMLDRCETDLGNIKVAFEIKYKQSLENFIKSDTSGEYKDLLLAILECKKLGTPTTNKKA